MAEPAQYLLPLKQKIHQARLMISRDWAIERLELHLKRAIEEEKISWEKNPRKSGVWEDGVDFETCMQMCLQSLEWHLQRYPGAFEEKPLDLIQSGGREQRILAKSRWLSISIRFEQSACRGWWINSFRGLGYRKPWFVDPSAEDFAMNAVIPEHFFMGEYDLVTDGTGKSKLLI